MIKLQYFQADDMQENQNKFNEFMDRNQINRDKIVKIYSTSFPFGLGVLYLLTVVYEE